MARREKSYAQLTDDVAALEEKLRIAKERQAEAKKAEREKVQKAVYDAASEVFEHDFLGMKKSDIIAFMKDRLSGKPSVKPSKPYSESVSVKAEEDTVEDAEDVSEASEDA